MLIADGGGGYGGTNWAAMDVVGMWQAVENQDTTPHWQMLSGWRKSYELTLQHMSRVKSYRENLAAAWPPEKSPASAAYLVRLDQLIENLQATYDAAVANYGAFSGATSALSTTRYELKKIYDEYVANQAKLADFKAKAASRPAAAGKYVAPPAKPPVTDAQLEQLNNKARTIMYGLSTEIIQARSILTTPKPYAGAKVKDDNIEELGGTYYSPPPIPPVIPPHPDGGGSPAAVHAPASHSAPTTALPSSTPIGTPSPTGTNPGLVLGGVSPSTVITPPSATGIVPPTPVGPGPIPGVINPTPLLPPTSVGPLQAGTPPPTTGIARGAIGAFGGEGAMRPGAPGMTMGSPRAIAPGGVIGGAPGMGVGQPGTGPRATQRINPVGGVINPAGGTASAGQTGRGTGQPGRAVTQMGQPLGSVGGRSGERRDDQGSLQWDPDNPWETAEGVSPVVAPSTPQRVDPGPAIGLD